MKFSTTFVLVTSLLCGSGMVGMTGGLIQLEKNSNKIILADLTQKHRDELNKIKEEYDGILSSLDAYTKQEIAELKAINDHLLQQNTELISHLESIHLVEDEIVKYRVQMSHYTAGPRAKTSTGTKPIAGQTIAVSHDLYPLLKGKRVWIVGTGRVYKVEDKMAPRWNKKIDRYVSSTREAINLGVQHVDMIVLPDKV